MRRNSVEFNVIFKCCLVLQFFSNSSVLNESVKISTLRLEFFKAASTALCSARHSAVNTDAVLSMLSEKVSFELSQNQALPTNIEVADL